MAYVLGICVITNTLVVGDAPLFTDADIVKIA